MPPSVDHPLHDPLLDCTHIASSTPRARTVTVPGDIDAADGAAVTMPPRLDQPLQLPPSNVMVHSARSAPTTNTSTVPGDPDVTAGADLNHPPSEVHGPHDTPSKCLVHSA